MKASFNGETRAAYDRWAPTYPPTAHNPLMRAEQHAMLRNWPDVTERRALDLGCGTGRYSRVLADAQAADIVAVDCCVSMLRQVCGATRVCGDMMRLPFSRDCFDVVISGLALGHASDLNDWMSETARVLKPGGTLLYSDFHPEAARMGLQRSFKDRQDRSWTVPHFQHDLASQLAAAASAKLTVDQIDEVRVGVELRESFENSDEFYRRWAGLPIVLIVRAHT